MAYPKKTHCIHGHKYTKENTYFNLAQKSRKCRICTRAEVQGTCYRERRAQRCKEKQVWINGYLKSHPCVDCGESDPLVLVFDHCRGKKKRDVTGLTAMSISSILKEIKKCDVVCANDHARRTAKRANTIRWKLSKENTMTYTKLDALRILSRAYWYVRDVYGNDEAAGILHYKFNRERRMLMLDDLKPASVVNEGFNGPMPKFF